MKILHNRSIHGTLLTLGLWYLLFLLINSPVIPAPHQVFINFFKVLPEKLFYHLLVSLFRILTAILFSLVLGVSLGLVTGMSDKLDKLISPVIYILYPVPKIAFLPVFMILFGLGNLSKIILILFIIIFQIIVTTRDAVKSISQELFYSVKSLGMNKIQIYRHLVIPAVTPKIITSLRLSVGTGIAVVFFAENFATKYGIGYFIMNNWVSVNYLNMFSGILGLSLMGAGLFKLIELIENHYCYWVKVESNSS